jgi:hypothetical protein
MLYMQLHPCEQCGSRDAEWSNALTSDEGEPARRYWTDCPGCGTRREFVFRLPERPLLPPPHGPIVLGGDEPSQLLDAGEWLWLADLCARAAVPVRVEDGGRPQFDDAGRESLELAVAAMNEVLKFIPEDGESVPPTGFWTDRGREVRQSEPGRFRRERLEIVRDTYRDALPRAS